MASDVSPTEQLLNEPANVNPEQIEAVFDRAWKEAAGSAFEESSVRLRVLNLVTLVNDAAGRDSFESVMASLPQWHPCRGMLVFINPEADELAAAIAARCWRTSTGRRHICSEEILLTGGPAHAAVLSSAALALLVPDVPVVVWLAGMFAPDEPVADELLDIADRVIFDSARATDSVPAFDVCVQIRKQYGVRCTDMAWLRLTPWREMLAQLFDGAAVNELAGLQSIEIAGRPDAAEPLLLAGWLVSRLNLTPADRVQGGNDFRALLYAGTRGVRLSIRPEGDGLQAVRIVTPGGTRGIALHAESGHLHVDAPEQGEEHTRLVVQAPPSHDAAIIEAAFAAGDDGRLYDEAVEAARSLIG